MKARGAFVVPIWRIAALLRRGGERRNLRERTSYKRNDSEKLGLGTRRTYWAVTGNEEVVGIFFFGGLSPNQGREPEIGYEAEQPAPADPEWECTGEKVALGATHCLGCFNPNGKVKTMELTLRELAWLAEIFWRHFGTTTAAGTTTLPQLLLVPSQHLPRDVCS